MSLRRFWGRCLVDGESVHHINGVKDDNRPENLELWTRPQPSGIRVSDAVDWGTVDQRPLCGDWRTSNNAHGTDP